MVAKSKFPDRDFIKNSIVTDIKISRALAYSEATIPGGHNQFNGITIPDNSLIDHGQYWVTDEGERRYYYKGGCAGTGGSGERIISFAF